MCLHMSCCKSAHYTSKLFNVCSCVTPGAFDELTSLESLNLISNPFNCNCHMTWFADWLRQKGNQGQ